MNNRFQITPLPPSSSCIIGRLWYSIISPLSHLTTLVPSWSTRRRLCRLTTWNLRIYLIFPLPLQNAQQSWFRIQQGSRVPSGFERTECCRPIPSSFILRPFRPSVYSRADYLLLIFHFCYGFGKFHYIFSHISALLFLCSFSCLWSLDTVLAFHSFIHSSHIDLLYSSMDSKQFRKAAASAVDESTYTSLFLTCQLTN